VVPSLPLLLLCTAVLFALNMGASGMAPAFAVCSGARLLRPWQTWVLFTAFVTFGAVAFGGFVARTLGGALVPAATFDPVRTFCVLTSAMVALFLANLLKIPQSTSWVTVAAISMVGLRESNLRAEVLLFRLMPAWLLLPLAGFLLTAAVLRVLYPVSRWNYALHARLHSHQGKLKALAILTSCYVAVAIGANNVANVVGPLAAANLLEAFTGLALIAPLFGLGAVLLPAPAKTVGSAIVPLGILTACVCNSVVGTLLLFASSAGIPQSLVQLNAAAVLAVSLVKEGSFELMPQQMLRRIGVLWLVTPLLASGLTWLLLEALT
jgi:sulfate permease